ncbi:MAG: hypothetical protein ACJ703_05995, partial [Nitrososphaera sp.]
FCWNGGYPSNHQFHKTKCKGSMSINSNSTRSFALTARETVQVQGEGQRGENGLAQDSSKSVGARGAGSAANSFES